MRKVEEHINRDNSPQLYTKECLERTPAKNEQVKGKTNTAGKSFLSCFQKAPVSVKAPKTRAPLPNGPVSTTSSLSPHTKQKVLTHK